jgi:hypothetical protein
MYLRRPVRSTLYLTLALLLFVHLNLLVGLAVGAAERAPLAQDDYFAYLPIVSGSTGRTAPPPVEDAGAATFMEPDRKTGSPDIVVDAAGGLHVAYRYHVPVAEGPDAVYAYCPAPASQCSDQARWQRVNLGGPVDSIQLALTPAGQLRVLAIGPDPDQPAYALYWYGECDAQCLSSDHWQFVPVTRSYGAIDLTGYYLAERSFALDPQGRPRFVFGNSDYTVEPDLYGGYYAACDSGCLAAESWSVTRFTHQIMGDYLLEYETIGSPSLEFTSDGQPRLVAHLFPAHHTGDESGVYYFACDAGCDDDANWERARVFDRGQGPFPFWDIAVDGQNRPRIAVYKEDTLDDTGRRLSYLSCDADCLNGASWQPVSLGLPRERGDGVDLELDAQGRPRMAYLDGSDNLGYSWCDANCTTPASWQHGIADQSSDLEAEYPVARPVTCDAGLWDTYAPALALDGQGHPRIVYDGSYKARCQYVDPNDPGQVYDQFHEIWHSVRLTAFPQP